MQDTSESNFCKLKVSDILLILGKKIWKEIHFLSASLKAKSCCSNIFSVLKKRTVNIELYTLQKYFETKQKARWSQKKKNYENLLSADIVWKHKQESSLNRKEKRKSWRIWIGKSHGNHKNMGKYNSLLNSCCVFQIMCETLSKNYNITWCIPKHV